MATIYHERNRTFEGTLAQSRKFDKANSYDVMYEDVKYKVSKSQTRPNVDDKHSFYSVHKTV